MININPASSKKDEKIKTKQKRKTRPINNKNNQFDNTLGESINFEFQGTINELLNDLEKQEKQFLNMQTLYELQRYKSLVQEILKLVLDEAFTTQKLKKMKKNKADFIIVKEIDNHLIDISFNITSGSNKAFSLLKKIEEIRGLLLDLVS